VTSESPPAPEARFDELIHPSTRLSIVALLASADWIPRRIRPQKSSSQLAWAPIVDCQYATLPLPPQTDAVRAYMDREVVLGIRPECISDGAKRAADIPATRIEAEVEVSEPTGAETIVLIRIAGVRLRARVAPDIKLPPGRPASFSIDTRTICLFDPQTERLIA